jgi:hypothetical protein
VTGVEFVLLALAVNRWTRLAVADAITQPFRDRITRWADAGPKRYDSKGNRQDWRGKAEYLAGCPHCVGVWAAVGVGAVWYWCPPWGLAWWAAIVVPAIAAVTSLIAITLGHLED